MILLVHFRTSDFLSKLAWLQDVGNFQSLPENFRILEFFKKFSKNFKNVLFLNFHGICQFCAWNIQIKAQQSG